MATSAGFRATLTDLLDRVLDKGLIIGLDAIICVAGVPLLGLNLRAALAGIDTFLEYGMMNDWQEALRAAGQANTGESRPKQTRSLPDSSTVAILEHPCMRNQWNREGR